MKNLLLGLAIVNLFSTGILFFGVAHKKSVAHTLWNITKNETLASTLDRENPALAFAIAEYYFNHGSYDIEKAEAYYTRAIELNPKYLEAYYQRGRIFFIKGKFGSALTDINTVLTLNSEFKKAYYMYGLINGYAKNFDQAEYGFKEFIKRDSFNWAGYNDLAWIYFERGDYQKTLDTAKNGLVQDPHNPWLNNIHGAALLNLGDTEGAKDSFLLAKKMSEKMTGADWGRAYPGNNPALYETGITETRSVIEHNLALVQEISEKKD